MANKNLPASRNHIAKKTFSYSKGEKGSANEVSLVFTLRNDVKTQMVSFLECLKMAIKDVEEEIKDLSK